MIKIIGANSGDAHSFFELLRIYYPYYEDNEELFLTYSKKEEFVEVEVQFPKESFTEKFPYEENPIHLRHRVARWLITSLSKEKKVPNKWGILTGIRPIKFVRNHLLEKEEDEVYRLLINHYLVEEKLSHLLIEMAKKEEKLTKDLDSAGYSLYINIPFCPSRCHYCSYPTILNNDKSRIKKYINSLVKELQVVLENGKKWPSSIYIGGGTPTSIPEEQLERILSILKPYGKDIEFTVEAGRPETITDSMLNLLSKYGVNRISVNPQTMKDQTLVDLGRNHTVEDIVEAYKRVKKFPKIHVNMDLIVGLPGENEKDFEDTLEKIYELSPESITIHMLSLKNGSKLYEKNQFSFEDISSIQDKAMERNINHGFLPYYMYRQKRILGNSENIGYAKEGYESIYNMIMMEELQSTIGVGMGSTSKIFDGKEGKILKNSNFRNLRDYEERLDEIIEEKKFFLEKVNEYVME